MPFILISVPTDVNPKGTKKKLRIAVERYSVSVMDFKIPKLKIGTIDKLMQLSDELAKVDTQAEQVSKKIERSVYDMIDHKPVKEEEKIKKTNQSKKKNTNKKSKFELKVDLDMSSTRHGNKSKGNKREKVDLSPHEYVKSFRWDRLYDSSKQIKFLADDMLKRILKADDDLKSKMSAYSDFNTAVENIERKETGSLLVKPLCDFVDLEHITESEHLTTLMVVVPKNREDYFLGNYELLEGNQKKEEKEREERSKTLNVRQKKSDFVEKQPLEVFEKKENRPEETPEEKAEREAQEEEERQEMARKEEERKRQEKIEDRNRMCENVVPGSAGKKPIISESDFVLYKIVVFKKGVQNVTKLLRQERFTVRPYKYDSQEKHARKEHKKRLINQRRHSWNDIVRWCQTYFSRIFKMWIHIKALRCFVETILRYGLPPNFQAYVIDVKPKFRDKLRGELKKLYSHLGNASMMDEDVSGSDQVITSGMAGLTGEFFPYVSLDINLEIT